MIHTGFIYDIIEVAPNVTQLVLKRKHKDYYVNISFLAKPKQTEEIRALKLEKQDLVKIDYYVQSRKYNDRYYTEAVIEKIELKEKRKAQMNIDFETGEIL